MRHIIDNSRNRDITTREGTRSLRSHAAGRRALAVAATGALMLALLGMATTADTRTIEFAGRTWQVHRGFGGPGPNRFADGEESVWVDDQGALHMTIRKVGDVWFCSEVYLLEPLGYGTYRFQIASDAETYDPRLVVGLFTYLDDNHEIDIELTRQGDPSALAGNFTVQPYFLPGNMSKYELGVRTTSTHSFEWRPESIYFQSLDGHHVNPPAPDTVIHDWYYTGGSIPAAATEKMYINFYLFQGVPPANMADAELIVTDVTFTPAALVAAPWAAFRVTKGDLAAGNLQSVAAPDGQYMEIGAAADGGGRWSTTALFDAVSASADLTRLDLTIEASATGSDATTAVQLYDFAARRYVTVGTLNLTAADLRNELAIDDPAPYVRTSDRHVRTRIVSRSAGAAHALRIDTLRADGADD